MGMDTFKVVFLIDTSPLTDRKRGCESYRIFSLTIVRILLFLSYSFTKNKLKLKWSYKLYSTRTPDEKRSRVGLKTDNFLDMNSSSIELCFAKLQNCMSNGKQGDSLPPSRVLFETLASVLYELPWDIPDIASPARRSSSRISSIKKKRTRNRPAENLGGSSRSNFIFILSDCPHNSGDLATFSCNPNIDAVYDVKDVVKKLFLPDDLLIQLTKFNIGLHWVDTNPWSPEEQDWRGLSLFSELLSAEGGSVFPLASLALPEEIFSFSKALKHSEGDSDCVLPSVEKDVAEGTDLNCCLSEMSQFVEECLQNSTTDKMERTDPSLCQSEIGLFDECSCHAPNSTCSDTSPIGTVTSSLGCLAAHVLPQGTSLGRCLQSEKVGICRTQNSQRSVQFSLHVEGGSQICYVTGSPIDCSSGSKLSCGSRSDEEHIPFVAGAGCGEVLSQDVNSCCEIVGLVSCQDVPFSWLVPGQMYICTGVNSTGSTLQDSGTDDSTHTDPPPRGTGLIASCDALLTRQSSPQLLSSDGVCTLPVSIDLKKLSIVVDKLNVTSYELPTSLQPSRSYITSASNVCKECSVVLDNFTPVLPTTDALGGSHSGSFSRGSTEHVTTSQTDCLPMSTGGESGLLPTTVHSRRFQALLIVLARRGLSALVEFRTGEGTDCVVFGLLQPVSTLRASLTFVKQDKREKIRGILSKRRVNALTSTPATLPEHCQPKTVVPSSLELYADLSCLFEGERCSDACGLSQDQFPMLKPTVASFSQCLLPWFRHHPYFGADRKIIQSLEHLQANARSGRRREYVSALKLHCTSRVPWSSSPLSSYAGMVRSGAGLQGNQTAGECTSKDMDSVEVERFHHEDTVPEQLRAVGSCDSHVTVDACTSIHDVFIAFEDFYKEQLLTESEAESMYARVHRQMSWAQTQLSKFTYSLFGFMKEKEILKEAKQIKDSFTHHSCPRQLSNEMILQLFLYLESFGRDPSAVDVEDISEKVAGLCRSLLFSTAHGVVGKLFNNTVIPCYGESCQALLTNVYEELSWPLPPVLGGDVHSEVFAEDKEDREASSPTAPSDPFDVEPPRAPASTGSIRNAPLQRHLNSCSFLSKEIPVTNRDKRKKLRKTKSTAAKCATNASDLNSTGPCQVKRSLFTRSCSTSVISSTPASPSHSLVRSASSPPWASRKRTRSTESLEQTFENVYSTPKKKRLQRHSTIALDVTCVKETPVKKQVSNPLKLKMRRARFA
jgi:hypothetical protein